MQREIITTFYEGAYRELVLNCGMRSSKSFVAALIGLIETVKWMLLDDPYSHYKIHPSTDVYGLITAVSLTQAQKRSAFMYYRKMVMDNWWFQEHGAVVQELAVKFPGHGLEVDAMPSSSASQAGGTLLFVIMDEIARFVETDGSRSGDLVYDTLKAGTKTLDGKIIVPSSPIYVRDKIMRLMDQVAESTKHALDNNKKPSMLAYHLATWEMNPHLTRASFDDDFRTKPETASRDWGAEPSYALEPFFAEPQRLDTVMRISRHVNPVIDGTTGAVVGLHKKANTKYFFHGDPALKNDSFGLAVAHHERGGDVIVLDLVHRFIPKAIGNTAEKEIDAELVRKTITNIHQILNMKGGTFDTWHFPETIQALRKKGLKTEQMTINIEHYEALKERVYMDPPRIRIPIHKLEVPSKNTKLPETVYDELKELDRVKGKKVDHPSLGCKDTADAVAGATWNCILNIGRRQRTEVIVM